MNLLLVVLCGTLVLADEPEGAQRVPWTTSRIAGSPDPPPPYKVQLAFPHLKFDKPTVITPAPGTNRLFVTEQHGKILSFDNDPNCEQTDLVTDLKQTYPDLHAIYGLTFHPDFERNRYVFVCYVLENDDKEHGTRVSRFEMSELDPPRLDVDSEQLLLTWLMGGHNGGCLKFGPDGYLYISTGDAGPASPPDPLRVGQDVSNLLSSILRIDVDHADADKAYSVPHDNPFVDLENVRPEIWSYGFRNPWKISFDRQTGELWTGDVGWELWEMVYRVEKGGNYGWSVMEGRQVVHPEDEIGPTPILPPTLDHPHSEAASITGGFVYRGSRLEELQGAYIYGDFQSGIVWGARFEGTQLVWKKELARTPLQLVGFGEDNAGELFLLDYRQQVFQLVENSQPDNSGSFPRRLSETGLFASVADHQPAAGVIPYSINAEQWSDQTHSERWFAVPGHDPIEIDEKGNWLFPEGSVIVKTVSIEARLAGESTPHPKTTRLETQILHREASSWRPYSYVWNESQSDAELVESAGFTRLLQVEESAGEIREVPYRFAARTECLLCHNPWVEKKTTIFGVQSSSPLAVSTLQLNRDHPDGGLAENQLTTYRRIGLLEVDAKETDGHSSERFANPYDESADLNARARAYLHVNCAHCHQFNAGGAATIALSHDVKLEEMKAIGVRPSQGSFGISDAQIIAPGDPLGSVLLYRIAKLGGGRMPRLGSEEVDERAVRLLHDWIAQIHVDSDARSGGSRARVELVEALDILRAADSTVGDRKAAIERLVSTTRGAMALLQAVDRGELARAVRTEVVAETKEHSSSDVRDLFERFVPASQRVKRLGMVVNHSEILSLEADVERGKQVFFNNSAAACKSCHRIQGTGEVLGPDLTEIGKKYRRDQLLAHILEPSKFMDTKYIPYLLETTAGQVMTGLLESQDDDFVVLRDAQNKLHRIPAADVELLVRQHKSLMPELLLKDMTPNEVADLLAYLVSLK